MLHVVYKLFFYFFSFLFIIIIFFFCFVTLHSFFLIYIILIIIFIFYSFLLVGFNIQEIITGISVSTFTFRMWRNVSFVDRIELDFSGNLFNNAIVLGDVDNDQVYKCTVILM